MHLIELVRASGANGVGLDPLSHLLERARQAVAEAGLEERVELVEAAMQHIPFPDASFDLVWCRDVIEIVEDLDAGVVEMARVLRPGAQLIVFTVVATDRLEPKERRMLTEQSMALVADNLTPQRIKDSFRRAGLTMVTEDEIGTEWREYSEERRQTTSHDLLQLARLRRQRNRIVEQAGEDIYAHIEANLHWLVYQFLEKLMPTIYVLRKPG